MRLSTFSVCLLVISVSGDLLERKTPNCYYGREGQVLVHLFSWKWPDIAREYRPWWERYQPVSYKLDSASGSRDEFIDMVNRCKAAGVQIYIDAVINHMAGIDAGTGLGSGGSYYNTQLRFDGVPYGPDDFNTRCTTGSGNIENYADEGQVRNCRLVGLLDLEGGKNSVRSKIADYFDDMLQIGIDGYRIDAAKHMWPEDINATLSMTGVTEDKVEAFVYQEVIENGNEPVKTSQYTHIGRLVEFQYGYKMGDIFKWQHIKLSSLHNFGSDWSMMPSGDALVSIDNHDNQRGHGAGGNVITHKQPEGYKLAVIFMLSWPYGIPRVMSSYDFDQDWTGPPAQSPADGESCGSSWICEHSRGSASFIAFNREGGELNMNLPTGLPGGTYCDVISGDLLNGVCTGKTVTVFSDSTANIRIGSDSSTPVVAIHIGAKATGSVVQPPSGSPVTRPTTQNTGSVSTTAQNTDSVSTTAPQRQPSTSATPTSSSPISTNRTIVFINRLTRPGEDVFLRGGLLFEIT
ncbi:AMY2A [Bugula neritina]|uniref:Alpha-amylase n=1 Tax=Bugula neritina TaxID=10212 RepID=A0A7J7JNB4_BUGNE|nr:AMY2A [Bugula neritina]